MQLEMHICVVLRLSTLDPDSWVVSPTKLSIEWFCHQHLLKVHLDSLDIILKSVIKYKKCAVGSKTLLHIMHLNTLILLLITLENMQKYYQVMFTDSFHVFVWF